jgi:phage gpG-like protein
VTVKTEVIGYKDFDKKMQALAYAVRPQVGLASSLEEGAWEIVAGARHNIGRQTLIDTRELENSILPVKVNQYRVDVRVGVPYGAVHEYGGTFTITDRQRRFFWAKYSETNDDMWKALALSKTYTIPPRPYLRPAIDEYKQAAIQAAGDSVRAIVEGAVG